jgi:hypothetical protein
VACLIFPAKAKNDRIALLDGASISELTASKKQKYIGDNDRDAQMEYA